MTKRRKFLKSVALSSGTVFMAYPLLSCKTRVSDHHIACQQYTWFSYFKREGKSWMEHPELSFKHFVKAGLKGYEPSFKNPDEVANMQSYFMNYNIWSKSMYANSILHEPELVEKSISDILAIAIEAKKAGMEILVTNPTPIRWGGPENKTDDQLKVQALALNLLGKRLKAMGMTLAYHNHDAEMRESAREFHHMLTGTDPEHVKLCLDAHWIYRGSGNSEVALFDIVELYADRIVELHLRQSNNGIWSEVFGKGDIDYARLANVIAKKGLEPLIVLEQAVEDGTPQTMSAVEAIQKGVVNATKIFT